jgi:solute carrier family 25 S-adenosylmethionine transporter 26
MQTASLSSKAGLVDTIQLVLNEPHTGPLATLTGGLYRGYGITLMREIPFAMIQFPLYEELKRWWSSHQGVPVSPLQAAACGSITGGFAAGLTTPLDVLKTRLMLGKDKHGKVYKNAVDVLKRIVAEEGLPTLMSGVQPRVFWISLGGFVFFGAYETSRKIVGPVLG